MKNWKLIVAVLAIFWFTVAFTACDDKNNDPVLCNCLATYGTLEHLGIEEYCTCPATVKPCGCTEQFDYLDEGNTIKIRKENGISVEELNTAKTIIQDAYSADTYGLNGKITAVHVTRTGKVLRYDVNKIIWMNLDEVTGKTGSAGINNFRNVLDGIRNNSISPGYEYNE